MSEIISVIVPIYKVEKYVKKCIDSILNQTYSDLDIILVDDGSPDECGTICDDYATKDKRIRVIHKWKEQDCAQLILMLLPVLCYYFHHWYNVSLKRTYPAPGSILQA